MRDAPLAIKVMLMSPGSDETMWMDRVDLLQPGRHEVPLHGTWGGVRVWVEVPVPEEGA